MTFSGCHCPNLSSTKQVKDFCQKGGWGKESDGKYHWQGGKCFCYENFQGDTCEKCGKGFWNKPFCSGTA